MEVWKEIFENKIPHDQYQVFIENGEEKGLNLKLISSNYRVTIKFGVTSAFRMIDEGILLNGLFDNAQIDKFKRSNFSNIIYQVENGEFDSFINNIADKLYEYLALKHFVIVTLNYVIEVITEWQPEISVISV